MRQSHALSALAAGAAALAALALAGCNNADVHQGRTEAGTRPAPAATPVPAPLTLLLPQSIRLHEFTGTRVFDQAGGVTGIDVRIEALDAYGDANKAFGQFRFELFRYKPNAPDPKGERLEVWDVDVDGPEENRRHWNSITRTYQFKLAWEEPVPVGKKFVLAAVFDSRFTPRLFHERVFVSGQ